MEKSFAVNLLVEQKIMILFQISLNLMILIS